MQAAHTGAPCPAALHGRGSLPAVKHKSSLCTSECIRALKGELCPPLLGKQERSRHFLSARVAPGQAWRRKHMESSAEGFSSVPRKGRGCKKWSEVWQVSDEPGRACHSRLWSWRHRHTLGKNRSTPGSLRCRKLVLPAVASHTPSPPTPHLSGLLMTSFIFHLTLVHNTIQRHWKQWKNKMWQTAGQWKNVKRVARQWKWEGGKTTSAVAHWI